MSNLNISHTDFVVVHATDFDTSAAFYEQTLGLEFSKRYGKIPGGELETGNLTLQIIDPKAIGQEFAKGQAIALHVDDVAAARAELESHGVTFLADTMDSGICQMAFFEDPSGNPLILHNRYAPAGQEPG